ncbi:hypothetical protein M422DRAFT_242780 [Sphaerobolus stellatus SS14]|nr:hypothetical protein M422DRAFT_242780 [Sphaerobolus stellatus SS14]
MHYTFRAIYSFHSAFTTIFSNAIRYKVAIASQVARPHHPHGVDYRMILSAGLESYSSWLFSSFQIDTATANIDTFQATRHSLPASTIPNPVLDSSWGAPHNAYIVMDVSKTDYDDDTHSTSLDDLRTPPQAAPPTSPSSHPSHTPQSTLRRRCMQSTTGQSPDTLAGVESDPSPTIPLPARLLHRLHLINHSSYLPPPPALLPDPISLSTQLQLQTPLLRLLFRPVD